MQYWKNFNNGKMERLENELEKHPEKLDSLISQGYVRVQSEFDDSEYNMPKKKTKKKKK